MRFRKADRDETKAAAGYAFGAGLTYASDNRDGLLSPPEMIFPGLSGGRWADVMSGRVGLAGRDDMLAVNATLLGPGRVRNRVTVVLASGLLPVADAIPVAQEPIGDPESAGEPLCLPMDLAGLYRASGVPTSTVLLAGPVLTLMRARPDLAWSTAGGNLTVWDDGTRPVTDLPARLALVRAVLLVGLPGAFRERG